jgi:hypothetical protein
MSVLVKKLYFDIYNLENDLKNKEQMVRDYQVLFDEYILNYKEQNSNFATTYNEIDQLNKKIVQKEFEKTINDIEQTLKNTARSTISDAHNASNEIDNGEPITGADGESAPITGKQNQNTKLESVTKNYRDIVKITHPDKTANLDEKTQQEYENHYRKATSFYDDNDLYSLMLINKLIGNNPFNMSFTDSDADNLKTKKEKIQYDIQEIQRTFIWRFMSIEKEDELNRFISDHFKKLLKKMK